MTGMIGRPIYTYNENDLYNDGYMIEYSLIKGKLIGVDKGFFSTSYFIELSDGEVITKSKSECSFSKREVENYISEQCQDDEW